jgi:hypothetical protein
MNILEGIMGGGGGSGGGLVGGLFSEFREGFVGGCLGIVMSAGFFFLFFFTLLAWLLGVNVQGFIIELGAFPIIALLCVSGMVSPVIGIVWGAKTGAYSMIRHIGCFGLYIIAMAIAVIALSSTV